MISNILYVITLRYYYSTLLLYVVQQMPLYHSSGGVNTILTDEQISNTITAVLTQLGKKNKVIILPPDFTRFHSKAGVLTKAAYRHYGTAVTDIMPALGTHAPMTEPQLEACNGICALAEWYIFFYWGIYEPSNLKHFLGLRHL